MDTFGATRRRRDNNYTSRSDRVLGLVRSRIYGRELLESEFQAIVRDIVDGQYSNLDIAAFLTACATRPLVPNEVLALTRSMVDTGDRLSWSKAVIADKHSVGGLPGNRTTPIVVSIVAALGLTIPKTSSRAITSPSGTADTMETLAPIDLTIDDIHRVVELEGACLAWGGAVHSLLPTMFSFVSNVRSISTPRAN